MSKSTRLSTVCFFMLLSACAGPKSDFDGMDGDGGTGIVGGAEATKTSKISKYAVLVKGIYPKSSPLSGEITICTGSFIANDVVITAAHCFDKNPSSVEIVYTSDVNDYGAAKSVVANMKTDVQIHEKYTGSDETNGTHIDDDIALIKIKGNKPADYRVLQIAEFSKTLNEVPLTLIGYGQTSRHEADAGILRTVNTKSVHVSPTLNSFILDQAHGSGVCVGDSGGPVLLHMDGQKKLLGVVKAVYRPKTVDNGGRYGEGLKKTDICHAASQHMTVQYYKGWIARKIKFFRLNQTLVANSKKTR